MQNKYFFGRCRNRNSVGLLLSLIIVCSVAGVYIDTNNNTKITKLKY